MNGKVKKILFVATEYGSGMVPFASSIINTLSNQNVVNVFAVVVEDSNLQYRKTIKMNENTTFIQYPTAKSIKLLYKIYPWKIIDCIKRLNQEYDFDIIHFLTGEFSLALWLAVSCIDKNRLFYTVHDLKPHETKKSFFPGLFDKYINTCNILMRNLAKNLTTSSLHQFNILKNMYPHKNVNFTHFPTLITKNIINGMNKVKELEGINDYILFFGNVDIYKGVDILIEAYLKSKLSLTNRLVIAGKGLQLIKDDNQIIRINRYIKDEEIKDLFVKSKLVVFPYISATMSGVLSLAFFFEKKIVLSDVPFFLEYRTSNTVFFNCGDVEKLRISMENAIQTNPIKEDSYNKFYSERQLLNEYLALYSHL